jgi:cysteine-rich repeat protein
MKLDYTNTDVRKYTDVCYDNNNVDGDGCNSSTCTIEKYYFCLYNKEEKKGN